MKIYRSILLNDGETINTENLGRSWTLCEIFAEDHANDINNARGKDGVVILKAEINEDDIDWNNTLFAMEKRSHEYEVVVNNIEIEIRIHMSEVEGIEEGIYMNGKTGNNNFEDYTENYEGDLTVEDFFNVANEF